MKKEQDQNLKLHAQHNAVRQLHEICLTQFEHEEQKSESFEGFLQAVAQWVADQILSL